MMTILLVLAICVAVCFALSSHGYKQDSKLFRSLSDYWYKSCCLIRCEVKELEDASAEIQLRLDRLEGYVVDLYNSRAVALEERDELFEQLEQVREIVCLSADINEEV